MGKPRFSIIIPTLNEEKFLPNLLHSLARQTVKDFEVIVVDGHSKDDTVQAAKKFASKLPKLSVILLEGAGVSRQRNRGAKEAKSDWLVFVDADSVLLSNFIERIGIFIDRKHPKFFTTWLKADSDDPSEAIAGFLLNMGIEGGIIIDRPWAPGPLTVIHKTVFNSVGGYNEQVVYGEDHELGVAVFRKGTPFQVLREILYVYSFRRHRMEGRAKVFNRELKALLSVVFTQKGLKNMPGFESAGSLYHKKKTRTKKPLLSKEVQESLHRFFAEFME